MPWWDATECGRLQCHGLAQMGQAIDCPFLSIRCCHCSTATDMIEDHSSQNGRPQYLPWNALLGPLMSCIMRQHWIGSRAKGWRPCCPRAVKADSTADKASCETPNIIAWRFVAWHLGVMRKTRQEEAPLPAKRSPAHNQVRLFGPRVSFVPQETAGRERVENVRRYLWFGLLQSTTEDPRRLRLSSSQEQLEPQYHSADPYLW